MKFLILMLLAGTANASGFYVEGGLAALENGSQKAPTYYTLELSTHEIWTLAVPNYRAYDINNVRNPYGALSIGYDWSFKKIKVDFQLQHESAINSDDHGINSVRLNLRWYPFHQ